MHRLGCLLLFLSFLFVGCGSSKKVVEKPKINIAIMDFESRAGMKPGEAQSVSDLFSAALQQTGRFTVIDRKQINAIMQEQGFQASQDNSGNATKAAHILAVKKFLFGSIGKLGDNFIVGIKMVDVESSNVELAITKTYDDDLEDIHKKFLPNLVTEVVQAIDGPAKK